MARLWAGLLRKAGTPAAMSRSGFHAQGRLREKETLLSLDPWRRAVAGHSWEGRISFLCMFSSQSSETRHSSLL